MSEKFINAVKARLDDKESITENGAVGFATSGSALVDINFAAGSFRDMPTGQMTDMFVKAYAENPRLAVKWLAYLRDAI